jgi:hypothetical protein
MPKLIVGINGLAQHGKDTTAVFLQNYLKVCGYSCDLISFAKPIKDIAKYVFDMTEDDVNTSAGKKHVIPTAYGLTSRQILQKLGTEAFRDVFSYDIWTDFFARSAEKSEADVIAIPDMRFDNEIDFVKGLPTTHGWSHATVKIFNPNVSAQAPAHLSEKPQPDDKFDAIILNDRGLGDLQCAVEQWADVRILPRLYA